MHKHLFHILQHEMQVLNHCTMHTVFQISVHLIGLAGRGHF